MRKFDNFFGDQLANFRPNFVRNCEFRFFVQNAKFRDFIRFSSKTNFIIRHTSSSSSSATAASPVIYHLPSLSSSLSPSLSTSLSSQNHRCHGCHQGFIEDFAFTGSGWAADVVLLPLLLLYPPVPSSSFHAAKRSPQIQLRVWTVSRVKGPGCKHT